MSLGPQICIAYRLPGVERVRWVRIAGDGSASGGNDARELGIVVRGNEEVRRVSIRPSRTVIIDSIEATMSVAIGDADKLFLNGYSSWTDSVERDPGDRMWGLSRAPHVAVSAYALDGGGDYRFVTEDTRGGHQHGFGYGYLRQGDEVLFFGSLDEGSGFTLIREDLAAQTLTFVKEPPAKAVQKGTAIELLSLAVLGGRLDDVMSRWTALCGIRALPAPPLVGVTSWGHSPDDLDSWKLETALESCAHVLDGGVTAGLEPAFEVYDGYAKVGDWLECDCSRFNEGMRAVAHAVRERGFLPGLWLAPFICERGSRLFGEHPEWLLRDESGELVPVSGRWDGAFALDSRNADVRAYVGKVLHAVTQDWGFGLLRLDYLHAACMLPHDGLNRGQLMADALDLLRQNVSEDTKLAFCGVPLTSAFGRCEYCRVGQDMSLDWDGLPHMRILHRERASSKLALANARGRAHLDGVVFRCDPGVFFLRGGDVRLTDAQRSEMLRTDVACGGVLMTSDDMGQWDVGQLDTFHDMLRQFCFANGIG